MKHKWRSSLLAIILGLAIGICVYNTANTCLGLSSFIGRLVDSLRGSDDSDERPLQRAVRRGNVKRIKRLLDAGADPNVTDDKGNTLLHLAASLGREKVAKLLIARGADIEARTNENSSPLAHAAWHNHVGIIDQLIAAGAAVDGPVTTFAAITPLFHAVQQGHKAAVKALIKHGANVNHKSEGVPNTPLHMAVNCNRVSVVKILLAAGANVNEPDSGTGMTAMYAATVAGHKKMVAMLDKYGADESIPDKYGQTPGQAKALIQARLARKLLPATDAATHFDHLAIVQLPYIGVDQRGYSYRGLRVGFVIDNGSLVLTAAHCIEDIIKDSNKAILVRPLVISRYYGDIFEAEIVAVDNEADVAILRGPWDHHPSLQLATMNELSSTAEIVIPAYPPPETEGSKHKLSREVFMERLPLIKVNDKDGKEAVVLGPGRFVRPGWSGSPMILSDSNRVVGVFGRNQQRKLSEQIVFDYLMGCGVNSIHSLLQQNNIEMGEQLHEAGSKRKANAEEAFNKIIDCIEALVARDASLSLAAAKELVRLRPQSVNAHLLLAFFADSGDDMQAIQLAESNHKEVLRLAPESFIAQARYANFLSRHKRKEQAVVEFEKAIELVGDNGFVMAKLVALLKDRDPNKAEIYAKRLVQKIPDDADRWFDLSTVLEKTRKYLATADAARKACSLNENVPYQHRRRLADALVHVGKLDEAESNFTLLLQHHQCAPCWFAYASLLSSLGHDNPDNAIDALKKAESMNEDDRVSHEALDKLRQKLLAAKKQPQSQNHKTPAGK